MNNQQSTKIENQLSLKTYETYDGNRKSTGPSHRHDKGSGKSDESLLS